mmetsp:Transcript_38215/g.59646  ORF Transcript_38215/g.59646 Transcript_38215/m.59646 type:complete len:635 (-) Transcript_38215:43-1947(-)
MNQVELRAVIASAFNGNKKDIAITFRNLSNMSMDVRLFISPVGRQETGSPVEKLVLHAVDTSKTKGMVIANQARLLAERASWTKIENMGFLQHEVKKPIRGLVGTLELLLQSSPESGQRTLIENVMKCCHELKTVIDQSTAVIPRPGIPVQVKDVAFDPAKVLETIQSQIDSTPLAKHLDIRVQHDDTLRGKSLKGDETRILQILSNFAWNAIRYTTTGSITLALATQRAKSGIPKNRKVVFSVADTGPGVPEDEFDFLTDTPENASGASGLRICMQVAVILGGRVFCESQKDVGSTFFLELELEVVNSSANPETQHPVQTPDWSPAMTPIPAAPTPRPTSPGPVTPVATSLSPMPRSQSFSRAVEPIDSPSTLKPSVPQPLGSPGLPGASWSFVVLREIIQDDFAMVLGESSCGDIKRQHWGTASFSSHGYRAIEEATAAAYNRCAAMFLEHNESGLPLQLTPMGLKDSEFPAPKGLIRVLVVDDEGLVSASLSSVLTKAGFHCVVCDDGTSAVTRVCQNHERFDICLMDRRMKMIHGEQATRAIRGFEQANGQSPTPVIGLSSVVDLEDQVALFRAGMDGFFIKPLNSKDIALSLKSFLEILKSRKTDLPGLSERASRSPRLRHIVDMGLLE